MIDFGRNFVEGTQSEGQELFDWNGKRGSVTISKRSSTTGNDTGRQLSRNRMAVQLKHYKPLTVLFMFKFYSK